MNLGICNIHDHCEKVFMVQNNEHHWSNRTGAIWGEKVTFSESWDEVYVHHLICRGIHIPSIGSLGVDVSDRAG